MNPLLEINNVSKKYDHLLACKNISFSVYEGEFLSIIGESGSGKSSLVKMIATLESITHGEIAYKDKEYKKINKKEVLALREELQMVFQDTSQSLNPKMKIIDIVTEPLMNFKRIKKSQKEEVAIELLEKVGLCESFLQKKAAQMSGGQRQRINIARALALNPNILILDEPTSALDVITQSKIISLLKMLQSKGNLTIILICHDIALVSKVADRIVVMKSGEICQILNQSDMKEERFHPYTRELLHATFNMNKCTCRFHNQRETREHSCS